MRLHEDKKNTLENNHAQFGETITNIESPTR